MGKQWDTVLSLKIQYIHQYSVYIWTLPGADTNF